jgi:hypothetical protein
VIYQLITSNSAAIELLTTIENDDHTSAVKQLRDWAEGHGYRLATGPGDTEATCTFMQNVGWFDDFQDETDRSIRLAKLKEIMMTTIRERCDDNHAEAIKALIDGLLRHESIKNFELDFNHNGEWIDDVCHGGAVTLSLIELLEMSFAPPELKNSISRAKLLNTEMLDLFKFEDAIKQFSIGNPRAIEQYFELPISVTTELGWNLQNDNWKDELPKIIHFWEQLTGQTYDFLDRSNTQCWENAVLVSQPRDLRIIKPQQVSSGL